MASLTLLTPATALAQAQFVFFWETTESNTEPYKWQGLIFSGSPSAIIQAYFGTGVALEHPQVVVTAGHLAFDATRPAWMDLLHWMWRYSSQLEPNFHTAQTLPVVHIWSAFSARELEERMDGDYETDLRSDNLFNVDFAAAGAFTNVAGGQTGTALFTPANQHPLGQNNLQKVLVGYPEADRIQDEWRMHRIGPASYRFYHSIPEEPDTDSFPWSLFETEDAAIRAGMSGGGVWINQGGSWKAAGINVAGPPTTVRAFDPTARLLLDSVVEAIAGRSRGVIRRYGPLEDAPVVNAPAGAAAFEQVIGALRLVGSESPHPIPYILEPLNPVSWLTVLPGESALTRESPHQPIALRLDTRGLAPGSTHTIPLRFMDGSRGEHRRIELTVHVAGDGAPGQPVLIDPAGIEPRSFVPRWNPVAGADAIHIDVARDPAFLNPVGGYVDFRIDEGSVIRGLVAGQTFYYRVRARNAEGFGPHSATRTVTLPSAPVFNLLSGGFPNSWGVLGYPTAEHRTRPHLTFENVAEVAAENTYTLFLMASGDLFFAGRMEYGGTHLTHTTPTLIATDVDRIAAGPAHFLFAKRDGSVWGLGSNWAYQLLDGSRTDRHQPVRLMLPSIGEGIRDFAVGANQTHLVTPEGTLLRPGNGVEHNVISHAVARVKGGRHLVVYQGEDGILRHPHPSRLGRTANELGPVSDLSLFNNHLVVLTEDRRLLMVLHTSSDHALVPPTVTAEDPFFIADDVAAFATAARDTLFRKTDGSLWVFGNSRIGNPPGFHEPVPPHPTRVGYDGATPVEGNNRMLLVDVDHPLVRQVPEQVMAEAGDTVTLEINVTGLNPSIQWFRGPSGNTNQPIAGATGTTYTTPPLQNDTTFWVRVSSPIGSYDSPA
ncbi:MAG: fibronectin type III domain-containing protein, partial [Puniceicoccaceae bacterium]